MGLSDKDSSWNNNNNDRMGMQAWQERWKGSVMQVKHSEFSAVLDSDRGQAVRAELANIMSVLRNRSFSPDFSDILERLGPVCEQLAVLTDFSFAVGILEYTMDFSMRKFLATTDSASTVSLRVDEMCQLLQIALLGYFGERVLEQNRLLAVPAGDTSNAVAEIMDSLHTP